MGYLKLALRWRKTSTPPSCESARPFSRLLRFEASAAVKLGYCLLNRNIPFAAGCYLVGGDRAKHLRRQPCCYDVGANLKDCVRGAFGEVLTVQVVNDRDAGVPTGFAFVEMSSDADGQAAIAALNGSTVDGQVVRVNEARPKSNDSEAAALETRHHREHRF